MKNKLNIPITTYYSNYGYYNNEIYHELNEKMGCQIYGRYSNLYIRYGIFIKVKY